LSGGAATPVANAGGRPLRRTRWPAGDLPACGKRGGRRTPGGVYAFPPPVR